MTETLEKSIAQMSDAELAQEMERRKKAKEDNRKAYKETVQETVPALFANLLQASTKLSAVKTDTFKAVQSLLELKKDVYGIKNGQQSHTFSTESGLTVSIGYRVIDGWDDTVNEGIAKVNEFLGSLAKDEDSSRLVKTVNRLLKKDAKGNLKANRVVELQQLADDFRSELFNDGIEILVKSYKPVKSSYFVEASYLDDKDVKKHLPLSLSSVEFLDGVELDLSIFQPLNNS